MNENNVRIPFEKVQKEIENSFKKMISDSCGTDIFQERNLIEAMIVSISNISIEYWQKREKNINRCFVKTLEYVGRLSKACNGRLIKRNRPI